VCACLPPAALCQPCACLSGFDLSLLLLLLQPLSLLQMAAAPAPAVLVSSASTVSTSQGSDLSLLLNREPHNVYSWGLRISCRSKLEELLPCRQHQMPHLSGSWTIMSCKACCCCCCSWLHNSRWLATPCAGNSCVL
jgi:hypothetical protein